ncbi:MAG: TonB-dependent receptor [Bacteroidetes bacterium]|nr:TonB-dependent receptor [Bacteroidota bacterium]
MKRIFPTVSFLFLSIFLFSQTQIVKGTIVDKQSEFPLIGATIEWLQSESNIGTTTDENGRFELHEILVGRQGFRISYLGYHSVTIPNVVVTSGKEIMLNISLEEAIEELTEIVVTAQVEKDKAQNDLATVSTRQFSLEEVTRFSGGRNDVARLASNFAGVSATNDSRNDIVIRGNSPTGVLWRLEGVPIPNPNHFATLGTTGGPVSAVNTNLLRNSDFMTSAFPSEYGNALSGVFDLGFRSGNKDRYEFTGQSGFSGLEFMVEGPIKKEQSSFLVSYRHSVLELVEKAGLSVGTNATPNYKDLTFNLDFGNTKAGRFTVFGIGGFSDIEFLGSETDENDLFADPNVDSYYGSWLGIVGVKHNLLLGKNAYIKTVLSASRSHGFYEQDELSDTEKYREIEMDDATNTLSFSSYYNKKFSPKLSLRAGILLQNFDLNTKLISRDRTEDYDNDGIPDWVTFRDFTGSLQLYQVFVQSQYKLNEQLTFNAGLHGQYFDFTNSKVLEPRFAINYHLSQKQTLSLGYGLHSQMQPLPVFFFSEEISPGIFEASNEHLGFTKSHHLVLAYDQKFGTDWRLKAETYFQRLYDIPVESSPSSFSMLNAGADFIFPWAGSLQNEGTGKNYGIELTVEKFFSHGYYGLMTASIYDSKYKGSDDIERNTAFDNGYVFNVLGGKEFLLGENKRNAFTLDMKMTTAGGRPYTPVDLEASKNEGEEVLIEEEAYSLRYDSYFRLDLKLGFRMNSQKHKLSQMWSIDFQNITNRENIFSKRYNYVTNKVNDAYQIGFFPDIMYRIEF